MITAVSEAGNIKANCKVTVVQKKAETITGKDDEKTPDRKPDTQSSIKLGKASIKSAKKEKGVPDSDHNACQKSVKSFRISDQSLSDFRKSKEKQRCNNNKVHNEKYEKTRRKE